MPDMSWRADRATNGQMWAYLLFAVSDTVYALRRRQRPDAREEGTVEEVPDLLGQHLHHRDAACAMVFRRGERPARGRRCSAAPCEEKAGLNDFHAA